VLSAGGALAQLFTKKILIAARGISPYKNSIQESRDRYGGAVVLTKMLGENFKRLKYSLQRWLVGSLNIPQTLSIQLDLTNACNLRCKHCYHDNHNKSHELTFEQWMLVLNDYDALRTKLVKEPSILLCGGEPLLSEHFFPMLDAIRARWSRCDVAVLSNGTLIDPSLFEGKDLRNVHFQVSLDGVSPETHNCVRGPSAFERTLKGLSYLRGRNVPFSLQAVLSKRTAQHIPEFFSLAKSLGATEMNFTRMVALGFGANLCAQNVDAPLEGLSLKNALASIVESSQKTGIPTATAKPLFCLIDENLGAPQYLGFQGIVIDPAGNMRVSSRTPTILGNVFRDGLEKTFMSHQTMLRLRAGSIEGCSRCPHFTKCGGDRNVAFAHSGSYFTKDPGCWL
jgi:MoaA/NifB/PqqE/SkfB family radical SAM enzyme